MRTIKRFGGWRYYIGTGVKVELEGGLVKVKGAPGFAQAYVSLADIDTVTIQVGSVGTGYGNRRYTYVELVGRGAVLGRVTVNTIFGLFAAKVAYRATDWLKRQITLHRRAAA